MIIKADTGTNEALVEVCAYHLGQHFVDEYNWHLSLGWFLDVELVQATDKAGQSKALQEIQNSLSIALRQMNALHPSVKRAMEWQVSKNLTNDMPSTKFKTFTQLDGEWVPFKSYDNLEILVRTALSSFLGLPADTPGLEFKLVRSKDSALSAANVALSGESIKNITYRQRDGETWQKALTVKRCRDFWRIAKGVEAPKTSSGPFSEFLGDIVDALGRRDRWTSIPAVMRAWVKCADSDELFL
ncbi:hypothetical protein [Ruegeria atlantica]|uniref:hypothetical protein n=1 Tax=Ruegeria atlantica TaxID=81569 RepID=UPI00148144EB|nr:hypothetical protein [Ruegeria atlantica]